MSRDVNTIPYTLVFSAIVCAVCSFALALVSSSLMELQKINLKLDNQRSVLMAAGLVKSDTLGEEVKRIFENVESRVIVIKDGSTSDVDYETYREKKELYPELCAVYLYNKKGQEAVVLPIDGVGLWGPLHGYLALASDKSTVKGISFYDHKETPGLGAEITQPWFNKNIQGKKLLDEKGDFKGIEMVKGKAVEKYSNQPQKLAHAIDGISGATLTGKGVDEILTHEVSQFMPFLKRLSIK